MKYRLGILTLLAAGFFVPHLQATAQDEEPTGTILADATPHNQPIEEILTGPGDPTERWEQQRLEERVGARKGHRSTRASEVGIDDGFITFGYIQSTSIKEGIRWQALTHIGTTFVSFASDGTISAANENVFLNRDVELLPGGAAEAAGTGVHIVFLNSGFTNSVTEAAMDNADGSRTTLINEITGLINQDKITNAPGYCQGVSFDFEPFSWSSTAANDIEAFFTDLRTALDAIDPTLEISWYGDAIPQSTQYSNLPDYIDSIDYILYSMYDWGTGVTPHSISDYNNTTTRQTDFLEDFGVPPSKLVPVISSYGRTFPGTTTYNVAGSGGAFAVGFTDSYYDVTLRTSPYTYNYETGDETAWYTDGSSTTVNPMVEGMEYYIRQALSFHDTASIYRGRRLGGVGFWSLAWLAETSSYEPIDTAVVTQTRTYTHTYDILQLALGTPGNTPIIIEGFEASNPRWEDPNHSPDEVGDTDDDSFRVWEATPGGAGAPPSSTNAVRLSMNFETGSGNFMFFRHELLAHQSQTSVIDRNAVAGLFNYSSELSAYVHSGTAGAPVAMVDTGVALAIMDADGELERGPYTLLTSAGWHHLTWDITDAGSVTGVVTSEPALNNGDGVIDTAGGGVRDIAFTGFLIEDAGGTSSRSIWFDEVTYTHVNPQDENYVINEFRYDAIAGEFVEIYGPAGTFPTGMQLRKISSADGTSTTVSLSGLSVPNDGGGFGYFVLGDPAVPNVDSSTGFSAVVDDISNVNPSGLQLYDTTTGNVYDSVVYEAFGGLGDLIRQQTLGVADEGYPWIGQIASGTGPEGAYTKGRYPDGADTDVNYDDFSAMPASPGASNGDFLSGGLSTTFSSVPNGAFQTFQDFASHVVASGVGASPNGGNVYRCVDTTGGGVVTFFGDKGLGASGTGYGVTGEIFIPNAAAPAQANAVGICGTQGETFFSGTTATAGYENGYWLIYENVAGVGMNDGQADHAGVFQFVHATHDNQDGIITEVLGSITATSAGLTVGNWTTFELSIDPTGSAGHFLLATINGATVYNGAIPTGGPTSGAFQVGFRENHAGAPAATEGTWIDNLQIGAPVPVELSQFRLE